MPTASQIVSRAQTVWGVQTVPYSMASTNTPTRHRADCSGYASAVLGLPAPGLSTVTLVTTGAVRRISWDELAPGDLLMIGGPGTEGANGHVAVYTGREGVSYVVWEQSGGVWGPHRSLWVKPDREGYLPYRLADLTPEAAATPSILEDAMYMAVVPDSTVYAVYPDLVVDGKVTAVPMSNAKRVDAWRAAGVRQVASPPLDPKFFHVTPLDAYPTPGPAAQVDVKTLAAEIGKLLPKPLTREETVQAAKEGANLAEDS